MTLTPEQHVRARQALHAILFVEGFGFAAYFLISTTKTDAIIAISCSVICLASAMIIQASPRTSGKTYDDWVNAQLDKPLPERRKNHGY